MVEDSAEHINYIYEGGVFLTYSSGFGRSIDPAPEGTIGALTSIGFWKTPTNALGGYGIFI